MGATLDYVSVQAETSEEAINIAVGNALYEHGRSPYSGTLATISDWSVLRRGRFESQDDFYDWVEENGDKRDGYIWQSSEDIWNLCGWCAC